MNVQIQSCDGIVTINIPPPESNRLWYGFRGVPKMRIKVQPWLGESRLSNRLLRRIIEVSVRKITQRMLVLPNMIEIRMPFLGCPNCDNIYNSPFASGLIGESNIDSRKRGQEKSQRRRSVSFSDEITSLKPRASILKNANS